MVTHNNWSKPIAYFLYFGFGKKAAGTFCWIMTALISPLSVSRSLFPPLLSLSFSPSRMVLVFICSVLCPWGMLAAQTFCAVCFLVCVCVYASVRHFLPVCVWREYISRICVMKKERGECEQENEIQREVNSVRSPILVPLTRLVVKQASSLIWHLYGEYTLSFYLSSPRRRPAFFPLSLWFFFPLKNAEMPHECVWKNEKHMGSVEKLAASPQNANVGFRVKHTLRDLHPHKYPLTYCGTHTHTINTCI